MISMDVKHGGELSRRILTACRERIRAAGKTHSKRVKKWRESEELFIGYMPEKEVDAVRRTKREEGTPEYTTIQLPYSYAVAMAAHSYWTSVFLSRSPVFQFMGNTDEGEMQVQAVEALINYQMYKARMLAPLFVYFQDVSKYGEAWVSPYWRQDISRVSEIVEEEDKYLGMISTGKMKKRRVIKEIIGYEGNSIFNVHPGKVFTDPRYPRTRFQDGEFTAIQTTLGMNQLREGKGQYINLEHVSKNGPHQQGESETYFETSNADLLDRPDIEDFTTFNDKKASDVYDVYEVCINIVPKDWGLGKGDMPEKWVFTVTTTFTTVLECRPLGNIHNKFPLALIEMEAEGYAQFSRSLVEVFGPIQTTLDWLVNSHFFNVRQVLNNQWLLDPSRIHERDLESKTPGKSIRLKPAAYGTDIRTALMQLPVADVTQGHMNDMNMMYQLGERLGVSDSVMGMSSPSSRRTAQEIRGTQTFGISRLKTISEYFSATGFSDLGSMLLMNSQQFYNAEMKLKLVGDAANLAGPTFLDVNPQAIAGEYSIEPVDGTLPIDRFAQANLWREMLMQMSQVPDVLMQYDMGKMFGYVAQLAGIKNLNRFKVEVVPDQMMLEQRTRGNSVPMEGAGNIMEPGQVPGNGPTA